MYTVVVFLEGNFSGSWEFQTAEAARAFQEGLRLGRKWGREAALWAVSNIDSDAIERLNEAVEDEYLDEEEAAAARLLLAPHP